MIAGIRGRLITASFLRDLFPELAGTPAPSPALLRQVERWWETADAALGPASSVRAVADIAVVPLLGLLDLEVTSRVDSQDVCSIETACAGMPGPVLVVVGWGESLSRAWRTAVLRAIAGDNRWALCANGTAVRIVDASRTWCRDHLEFDLAFLARDRECFSVLWRLVRGAAITAQPPLLDRAVALSARHGLDVCRALGTGAVQALDLLGGAMQQRRGGTGPARHRVDTSADADRHLTLQHAITALYRVLFVLFAEARGLVPMWHPIYRARYSLDTVVTDLLAHRPIRGLWHVVQAISRLAHDGCNAGELKVNAFNGRLFSGAEADRFDRRPLDDGVMAAAITAVSTRPAGRSGPRARILYQDLDVEQLGAVYEQVLEYTPSVDGARWTRSRDGRKASGTFYTPRAVTAFLVRRTLKPLVDGRTAQDILRLRVVDPAMGSGAILVAACQYLAGAAEEALLREGVWHPGDVSPADRATLRREIALRCLYGVDLNPMAVQLARLSIWLTTLAADKPLSFLDHHLVAGDSLVGARPEDVQRRPSRVGGRERRAQPLPLFTGNELEPMLEHAVRLRTRLSLEPDDTAAVVRGKERILASLGAPGTALGRWSRLLDLWCAGWFWNEGTPPDRALFSALSDWILRDRSGLPATAAQPLLSEAERLARRHRFLHWPLAFPEVFSDEQGRPSERAGFDAVLGNPPWDIVRGDSGPAEERTSRRAEARQLTDFVRESGVYRVEGRAHVNRYQLFLERALQIVRPGGRVGLVLPSGIVNDAGAAPLRRHLLDHADVDSITGLDNRAGIFAIHRSIRFALLTCTSGRPTQRTACTFGVSRAEDLERDDGHAPLILSRRLLARLSGEDDLGIPEMTSARDLRIVERIHETHPRLGSPHGWNADFGRELNASDDRSAFRAATRRPEARPIVEGKHLEPFRVLVDRCRLELRPDVTVSVPSATRARLAYRDVAGATNRLTLIAAIVPARAVTTHTLFCLKTPLGHRRQHVLCALLNSFVANYLVRMRVGTHVTVSLVSRLPVPALREDEPSFERLLGLTRALAGSDQPVEEMHEYAELQAIAARLFGLSAADFEHVLGTFPLVGERIRGRSLALLESLT